MKSQTKNTVSSGALHQPVRAGPRIARPTTHNDDLSASQDRNVSKKLKVKKTIRLRPTAQSILPETPVKRFEQAAGVTGVEKELEISTTMFFDYVPNDEGGTVASVDVSRNQFLVAGTEYEPSLSRVRKVEAWVLPAAINAQNADSTYCVLAGISAVDANVTHDLINTQTTVVKPDFNVKWTKILSADFRKIFDDSVAMPSGNDTTNVLKLQIVSPDTGEVLSTPEKVQVMVKVTFGQVLSPRNLVRAAISYGKDWAEASGPMADQFCILKMQRLTNVS